MMKDKIQGLVKIFNLEFLIFNLNSEANQNEMAVFRAEIQIETSKSSIPSFLAMSMPPPTVTIQTGHWAAMGVAAITNNQIPTIPNKI